MIVVSDMMGTLTTGSPILGLLDWVRHNQSRVEARLRLAWMMPGYLLVKLGLLEMQPWGQRLMIESLAWMRDATPEKFEQAAEWAVERNLWPQRRPDVIARLEEHAAGGTQVYIASSVVEPIAAAFARRIRGRIGDGVQAIGSPVRIQDGRVRLESGLVASERKIQEVLTRLNVESVDYAYGDTVLDIPLLENARHAVAVYPDRRLAAAAQARGWEILGEPL